jgi:monoamine oxidase
MIHLSTPGENGTMPISRRNFIHRVGQVGGYSAAYVMMQSMGLLPSFAEAATLTLQPGSGKGTKVVILGAGMAGLSAAYEMRKVGYDVTVLEARDRVGGHNWSIRRGTEVQFTDGTTQTCTFDEGMYFNAGPARLPSHHQNVLGYCRELGVELEVEVNASRSAYLRNGKANGGEPMQYRRVINDTRGHVSELLAKAINQGALDQQLSASDKERMVAFLKTYGDLSPDLFYKGSTRSGYKSYPGAADEVGVINDPYDMSVLLDLDMWDSVAFEDNIVMQATMFQPVGGMDQIPRAIGKKLGNVVKQMAEVQEIRRTDKGVRIVYLDRKTGQTQAITADYCISTIPLPVLAKIPADFSPEIKTGIATVSGGNAMKIAFQSRRFWEQDYNIYGGISFTKNPTAPIWHPSGGFHKAKGVLVYYGGTLDLAQLPLEGQYEGARRAIDGVYPGHGKELGSPVSIQWAKIPYNLGTGARFTDSNISLYSTLNEGDGPFYFANDYLSHVNGWQEGAVRSAYRVISKIDQRHHQARL